MSRFRDLKRQLYWVWTYWKPYKSYIFFISFLTLLSSILINISPLIVKNVIDTCLYAKKGDNLISILLIMSIYSVDFIVKFALQTMRVYIKCVMDYKFRQQIFAHIICLDPKFYNIYRTGDIITRLSEDAIATAYFFSTGIFGPLNAVFYIVIGSYCLFHLSPLIALWVLLPFPLVVIIFIRGHTLLKRRFEQKQKAIAKSRNFIEATFSGIEIVKAYCLRSYHEKKFKKILKEREYTEIMALKSDTIMGTFTSQIWHLSVVTALFIGGILYSWNVTTIGTIVAAMSYTMFLFYPVFFIGQLLIGWPRAIVSISRMLELYDYKHGVIEPENPYNMGKILGDISVKSVGYVGSNGQKLLSNISMNMKKGQKIGIVGQVGAGKSILARLIARLEDPTYGTLFLDNIPYKDISLETIHENISIVPQEPILFSETIKENILFGRMISNEKINWALEVVDFKKDLQAFPDGLDTLLGVRGVNLSGGQKQRLCIARAIIGNPQILILDDCASSLDVETQSHLWDNLRRELGDVTIVNITHTVFTLEHMDVIYIIENGKILMQGNHFDLLRNCSLYKKMYGKYL